MRWLVRLVIYAALAVFCLLLTSRWWLPAVLPGVLDQFGVVVASVERGPGGGLLVSELVVDSEGAQVRVDTVGLPNEVAYLRSVYAGEWSAVSGFEVGRVRIELREGESAAGGVPVYLPELYRSAEQGLVLADRWVPPVRVDAVEVSQGGKRLVSVQAVRFADRVLTANVSFEALAGAVDVRAALGAAEPWTLVLVHAESGFAVDLGVEALDGAVRASGQVRRAESELTFSAEFGGEDWLPVSATAQSEGFRVDPTWIPGRDGVVWERLRLAGVDLDWAGGRYRGTLQAEAMVVTEALGADELTAELALSGDLETLRVETCEVLASWVALQLSDPVSMDLRDWSVAAPAVVRADIDLAKQAFFEASGRVDARLTVAPSLSGGPDVGFELSAEDLGLREYAVDRAGLSGRLRGDALSVEQLVVQPLAGADDSTITASGVADFANRELDFDYALSLSGEWLNAQIGQAFFAGTLKTQGQLGGVFDRPTLAGQLAPLTLNLPAMVPVTLAGAYGLEGVDRLNLEVALTANEAVIETALDARVVDDTVTVALERLDWTDPVRSTLVLESPTQLSYQFGGESDVPESRLGVAPFVLSGPDLGIEGQWNPADGLALTLRNVSVQRVGRWFDRELPEVLIESVEVSLLRLRPQIEGSVAIAAEGNFAGDDVPLRFDFGAQLTPTGFSAERLRLDFAGAPLFGGNLAAPVNFQIPEADGTFWHWSESGTLEGTLSGSVSPAFSDWLTQNTGMRVKEAAVDLEVGGTLQKPVGRLDLRVDDFQSPISGMPGMDRIQLIVEGKPEQIKVERLYLLINQSELSGNFLLPVEGLAEALRGGPGAWRPWLAGGGGRLELVDWQAEDWVDVLPAMMRQSGRLDGELELQPGWKLRGSLGFDDFALRPTSSLPSVDSIGGQIELTDRRLSIRDASARVGGSPVELTGWVDADDLKNPLWEVAVAGTNVPLVRTTDMILRSDLDLKGSRVQRSETPLISGALNLRSSTLLAEFDPLAPNVETGPQSQPPYFSITDPAVADWRFDLKIAGDSFMRVRSPYFRTQLSANFDLGGTFAEPLLIGSVRTVGGELSFPGAKMRIASGEAFIEPSQPNAVQLDFSGTAQKASQIITMRVSQTLDDPLIQFQSTPALSNAAIVRLLATGSANGGGVGAVGLYLGQGLLGAGGLEEQISDRLTVDVGEETSRSGRNTVGARYDISEDYALEGGYDVYDAYNLDFIWSIFKQ
ncbi:MAG: hypothetical protein GVY36_10315 [Verrucomicrobia bacterium]|jgi:hypothetical protein|nr:hypothetical protein [Verrucomicrobiota bacterium]